MKLKITNQFDKEVSKISDKKLVQKILDAIELCQNAKAISDISNLKKLKGFETAYRIKIGDYRIGLVIEKSEITLSRFLHRKDIYRYFPK